MLRRLAVPAVALAAALAPQAAAAQSRTEVGVLECRVSGAIGLVVGSVRDMRCVFRPTGGGPAEPYAGVLRRIGLDIGVTAEAVLAWGVFAPTRGLAPGALAGQYVGATAEVTWVVGLGANVLVGGSNRTIALQPLSVGAQVGANIAAGVGEIELRPGT